MSYKKRQQVIRTFVIIALIAMVFSGVASMILMVI